MYRVADSHGLCIEVTPTGVRHWRWRYRYRFDGKATMLSLGSYPAVSLLEARGERDEAAKLLKAGSDPAAVARAKRGARIERNANTFAAAADELLAQRAKKRSPGSVIRERRMIDKDLAPLADMPIADITAPMLLAATQGRGARRNRDSPPRPRTRWHGHALRHRHWPR